MLLAFVLDCDTEIYQFQIIGALLKEEVFRLDVPMDDASTVNIYQGLEELTYDRNCIGLTGGFGDDSFEELSPFTEFEDQNIVVFVVVDLKETSNIGVV